MGRTQNHIIIQLSNQPTKRDHMKPGVFSSGVHRFTCLLLGSVINSHDPIEYFTLELFRTAYRNGLNRNASVFVSLSIQN